MEVLIAIGAFLVLVGLVVTIHEGGHFFTALACGMRVLEFSIGFGPKIYERRFGKDNILFTLRALPLGGFVKPMDQSTVSEQEWKDMPESEKARAFAVAPRWKKALMVAGGPASNFVLAFIVFVIAFTVVGNKGLAPVIGEILPNTLFAQSGLKEGQIISKIDGRKIDFSSDAHAMIANAAISGKSIMIETSDNKNAQVDFSTLNLRQLTDDLGQLTGLYFKGPSGQVEVKNVNEGKAADLAGIKKGDILVAIDGQKIDDMNKVLRIIRNKPDEEIKITYIRDGKTQELMARPQGQNSSGQYVGKLGIELNVDNSNQYKTVHYGLLESINEAANRVTNSTMTTLISVKKMITLEISTKAISGPLSIADYSGKSAQRGLYSYMMMIAAISIAVGVFNLLPVPMLDGGHLLQYAIEGVIRRDFTMKEVQLTQYIGIIAMCGMFTLAMFNDISKYFS